MPRQAGVFFFDGRPIEGEGRRLLSAVQRLALEGVCAASDAGVLMVYGASDTWSGERASESHSRSPSGLVMTWDGRLDNRDDLRLRLGRTLARDSSDAAIALSIFDRDGIEGLHSLIGDWSLVIWDTRRRRLHLARDYMGVRPLYYSSDAQSVVWSSSLGELATRTGRTDALDDRYVARFMALRLSTDVTPYGGIRAVPTASCVSFSAERTESTQRFWSLEPGVVRYRDARRYEEHMRLLWRDAVGARLRADDAVWAELSGGLDSSSVVCMADALIKDRSVSATAIRPLSHVTLQSPEGDERTFIAEVEERIGVRSVILGAEEHADLRADDGDWATPLAPSGVQVASIRLVQRHGGQVILSGRMGDVVMGCSSDNSVAVFDDFAAGRPGTALAKMRDWGRACRKPFLEIGAALVREALRSAIGNTEDRSLSEGQQAGVDLLTPSLRPQVHTGREFKRAGAGVPWSKRKLFNVVLGYTTDARLEPRSEIPGATYTYPFAHRPLVEFVLSIPGEELSAPGATRALMRRAFQGLVPDRVLRRVSKGHYSPAVTRAIRQRLALLGSADQFQVVRRGWIDAERLDARIRVLAGGGSRTTGDLQRVLCLEDWLILRDRRAPAAIPKGEEVKANGVLIA
jgi:asparagine synthase (glutamine-hydrolysing)